MGLAVVFEAIFTEAIYILLKKRILCTGFWLEAWFALARFGLIWHGVVF